MADDYNAGGAKKKKKKKKKKNVTTDEYGNEVDDQELILQQ
jgi:hypothetical protein